jgi:outer membrane lipoprotein SlyB
MKETIKTIICAICIATVFVAIIGGVIYIGANTQEALHIRKDKVQVIEANDGEYVVVDSQGEAWEFTSDRTYLKGEILVAKFDTLGTDSIFDDKIITVKS